MQRIQGTPNDNNKFIKGTPVSSTWLTTIQEELALLLEGRGIELDTTKQDQLKTLFEKLCPIIQEDDKYKISRVAQDGKKMEILAMWDALPVGYTYTVMTQKLWDGVLALSGKWLQVYSRTLSKTTYPELFEVIGYDYGGSGDVFYLPNFDDRFLRFGSSIGTTQEQTTAVNGLNLSDLSTDTAGAHIHSISTYLIGTSSNWVPPWQAYTNSSAHGYTATHNTDSAGGHTHAVSGSLSSTDTETRPKAIISMPIIKAIP